MHEFVNGIEPDRTERSEFFAFSYMAVSLDWNMNSPCLLTINTIGF